MPHATMDPRRHPGTGEPHENMYYTLQPARAQPMHPNQHQHQGQHQGQQQHQGQGQHQGQQQHQGQGQHQGQQQHQGQHQQHQTQQHPMHQPQHLMQQDNYGSLPSHGRHGFTDFPSPHSVGSAQMLPQSNYGTLPSQHSQLPSFSSSGSSGPYVQMGGYNSLPAQGGSYGTLPSHHDLGSRTLPSGHHQHQQGQMSQNRELPAPSLTRHSMKILQVPFMVVGDDNRDSLISRGSSSPSASPASTISDPGITPTSVPRSQPIHMTSSSQRPGQVQVQVESHLGTPPGSPMYGQGTFPTHQHVQQHPKFPPATQQQGSPQNQNMAGFPQSDMTSQGGFPHSGQLPSHGYVHAATLPHRSSSAIPPYMQQQQRPSPSSSPGSTTSLPATLPHPNHQHHSQHMHPTNQPLVRPSPTPSPIPRQPTVQILPAQSHPAQTPAVFHMHTQNPDSLSTTSHNNNKYNTFPGSMSQMVENPKVMSQLVENPKSGLGVAAPMMDISGKMWSMQEDMQRMQKQMEDSFRNMHVAPPSLGNSSSSFPDFPSIMPSPFSGIQGGIHPPSYADLATHATPSPISMSTPSLVEPDFGRMMSSDMGIGAPIVQDTMDGKGGKKQLKLNLDMHEFAPGEVKVRSDKNKLEVTAHHEEKDPNRITCRVFKQQYHLPENTRMAKLQYDMTPDGELKVEGTVKPRHRVKWSADTLTK